MHSTEESPTELSTWIQENFLKIGFVLVTLISFIIYFGDAIGVVDIIKNNLPIIILLGVSVLGWFVVHQLGVYQQRQQLKNEARLRVYSELYSFKKKVDEDTTTLGLALKNSTVLLLMSFENKRDGDKSTNNLKALDLWRKHVSDLSEASSSFTNSYIDLWLHAEMWIGILPQLKVAHKELFENQLKQLQGRLHQYINYLQNQSIKEFYWDKWDKDEITKRSEEIRDVFDEIASGYIDDYMVLIHNRLVSPIFGYKKQPRENFANMRKVKEYFILTEDGLKYIKNDLTE